MTSSNNATAKKRSLDGLQALLATVRSIDPATTAELGAIHNLRMHVAAPLHQMIEEALGWLENIDAMVTEQMPSLGLASPISSLPQSWRLLWQMSFSAQCELISAARDLDLTGCGWEEALKRCETAGRQIKEALRQVVGAARDLEHLERLEVSAMLASLGRPGEPPRQRFARGSELSVAEPMPALAADPALRPTERYPEAIIEQLCAESERESLKMMTVSAPERASSREKRAESSGPAYGRARSIRGIRAPLTLEGE